MKLSKLFFVCFGIAFFIIQILVLSRLIVISIMAIWVIFLITAFFTTMYYYLNIHIELMNQEFEEFLKFKE